MSVIPHYKIAKYPLQVQQSPKRKKHMNQAGKRASFSASLTVEAAMVLSLFFFVCAAFIYIIPLIRLQESIQAVLEETGDELVVASGLLADDDIERAAGVVSAVYVKQKIKGSLREAAMAGLLIRGGADGIQCIETILTGDSEHIDLIVRYQVKIPVPLLDLAGISFVQRCRKRIWSGSLAGAGKDREGDTVYKTPYGSVYHLSLQCKHLKDQVKAVDGSGIMSLRNSSGSIYYPCGICKPSAGGQVVYLTPYGTRYHSSASCREIRIRIEHITREAAGGMEACKDCGKGGSHK